MTLIPYITCSCRANGFHITEVDGKVFCRACGKDLTVTLPAPKTSSEIYEEIREKYREKKDTALDIQVGGNHYKDLAIQPVEYIHANKLPFIEGNIVKYITRWKTKNGVEDLKKVKHYVELLIELEEKQAAKQLK